MKQGTKDAWGFVLLWLGFWAAGFLPYLAGEPESTLFYVSGIAAMSLSLSIVQMRIRERERNE